MAKVISDLVTNLRYHFRGADVVRQPPVGNLPNVIFQVNVISGGQCPWAVLEFSNLKATSTSTTPTPTRFRMDNRHTRKARLPTPPTHSQPHSSSNFLNNSNPRQLRACRSLALEATVTLSTSRTVRLASVTGALVCSIASMRVVPACCRGSVRAWFMARA